MSSETPLLLSRRTPSHSQNGERPADLCIAVCCHNECPEVLRTCLTALRDACRNAPFSAQLMLVTNDGHDYPGSLYDFDIHLRCQHNHGITQLRNTAINATQSPFILFCDSHMLLRTDGAVLASCFSRFENNSSLAIIGGVYHNTPDSQGNSAKTVLYNALSGKRRLDAFTYSSRSNWLTVTGGLAMYRTALFRHIGHFPERYRGAACEDLYIQLRARKCGQHSAVEPALCADHRHALSWRRFYSVHARRNPIGTLRLYHSMLDGECDHQWQGYTCDLPLSPLLALLAIVCGVPLLPPFAVALALPQLIRIVRLDGSSRRAKLHAFLGHYFGVTPVWWLSLINRARVG